MRVIATTFALLLLLGTLGCSTTEKTTEKSLKSQANTRFRKLAILHWNDFHAQNTPFTVKTKDGVVYRVSSASAMHGYLDSLTRVLESGGSTVLRLDAGDDFQGTPVSGFTKGGSQILIENLFAPDIATIGNHEFDYGQDNLFSLYKNSAAYPVVCANLVFTDTRQTVVEPYRILEKSGLRIAVIGIITRDLAALCLPENLTGLTVLPYRDAFTKYLPEIQSEKPDVIIALTHCGWEDDKAMSKEFPEVDVFVGGHSHTALFEPVKVGRGLVVQAGARGRYAGKLELTLDTNADSIVGYSGRLYEVCTDSISRNAKVQAVVDSLEAPVDKQLGEVIGELKKDWVGSRDNPSNITQWQTAAIRRELHTDIGMVNVGGIRKSLFAGKIQIRDVYEINPFGNSFVTLSVSGADVKQMLEWQLDRRGEFCDMFGVQCVYDSREPFGKRVKKISVNGKPIDEKKQYSVATNNFVGTQLKALFGLEQQKFTLNPTPYIDHEFFTTMIRKERVVSGDFQSWLSDTAK
jgi:5'-nucleotidase / UDP-sugar diphosphatase